MEAVLWWFSAIALFVFWCWLRFKSKMLESQSRRDLLTELRTERLQEKSQPKPDVVFEDTTPTWDFPDTDSEPTRITKFPKKDEHST